LAPLPGSWRFLILEFTWAFETRLLFLKNNKKIFFTKKKKHLEKKCLVFTFPNMSMNCSGDIMIVYMLFVLIVVIVWKSGLFGSEL